MEHRKKNKQEHVNYIKTNTSEILIGGDLKKMNKRILSVVCGY